MNKILLPNRYGDKNYLVDNGDGTYSADFSFNFRMLTNADGSVYAVDPSGGPFLMRGYTFKDNNNEYTVEDIIVDSNDKLLFTITLKE